MLASLQRARSGLSKCQECGELVAAGELRVTAVVAREIDGDDREWRVHFHVDCAVAMRRDMMCVAIRDRDNTAEVLREIGPRVQSDPQIAVVWKDQLAIVERKGAMDGPIRVVPLGNDVETSALMTQLVATPDDRGVLAVLGDLLLQRDDSRGELIAIHLRLAAATPPLDIALVHRRDALCKALAAQPYLAKGDWGIGFLRRMRVMDNMPRRARTELSHDSARLLVELELSSITDDSLANLILPPSLRRLSLNGNLGALGATIARLPHLTELSLTLAELDLEVLSHALDGRRLHRLSLTVPYVPSNTEAVLSPFAARLDLPSIPPPDSEWVEHTAKPEWGRGRILRRFDDKLEVEFPSGTRTFKADAPFLRRV